MAEQIQDSELVKSDLLRQADMANERAPWESVWRDVERFVDPVAGGGFSQRSPGQLDRYNYDNTAQEALGRFDAALGAVTTPKNQRWHGLSVVDKDLAKLPAVQRWLEHATDRVFACRYAPHTGCGTALSQDRRQLGSFGTAGFWADEWRGRGLFYRSFHLSQLFIDVDFRGRVTRVHRLYEEKACEAAAMFGLDNLPPKMREAASDPKKEREKFQLLHVICPNDYLETERLDWRGKPIVSRYIAVDEKYIIRKGGYHTMPMPVSRGLTSSASVYGLSPAVTVMGTIRGVNEMARTILRAGHLATDPPVAFYDDGDITKLATKPGGMNPGLVDSEGRPLYSYMRAGGELPIGMELRDGEREVIKIAFLEHFFNLLTNPADRMTATQVLETVAKEGVLIGPFADAYETEKLGPWVERDLDVLLRTGQIDPMPPEMTEASARPLVVMTNPLARMARAGEAAAFTRWVEVGVQAAAAGRPDALDRINFDGGMAGVGEVLGVRPSWILSDDELTELRRDRAAKEEAAAAADVAPKVATAALDLARANEIAGALGAGGGL